MVAIKRERAGGDIRVITVVQEPRTHQLPEGVDHILNEVQLQKSLVHTRRRFPFVTKLPYDIETGNGTNDCVNIFAAIKIRPFFPRKLNTCHFLLDISFIKLIMFVLTSLLPVPFIFLSSFDKKLLIANDYNNW